PWHLRLDHRGGRYASGFRSSVQSSDVQVLGTAGDEIAVVGADLRGVGGDRASGFVGLGTDAGDLGGGQPHGGLDQSVAGGDEFDGGPGVPDAVAGAE